MNSGSFDPPAVHESGFVDVERRLASAPAGGDALAVGAALRDALGRLQALFDGVLSGALVFGPALAGDSEERDLDLLLIVHEPEVPEEFADLRYAADELCANASAHSGWRIRPSVFARKDLDRLGSSAPGLYDAARDGIVLCGDGLRRR